MKLTSLFVAITITSVLSTKSYADAYSFGGNCASQGSWTQAAILQMNEVRTAIQGLKDNEHCNSDLINNIYQSFDLGQLNQEVDETNARYETLPQEISSLQGMLKYTPMDQSSRSGLLSLLMSKTVEKADMSNNQLIKSFTKRSTRTLSYGMSAVSKLLPLLPKLDRCIYNNPGIAKPLFTGIFGLLSTFIGSGDQGYQQTSKLLASYTQYLQDKKFSGVLRDLDMGQFLLSMSCIIESTTESYCAAKEAYDMQDFLVNNMKSFKKSQDKRDWSNPLEGYFIVSRDVPVISSWIQKVQSGVQPRQSSDASYKNSILENLMVLLQNTNSILGTYSLSVHNYEAIDGIESQRNFVFKVIKNLEATLSSGDEGRKINFFTQVVSAQKIPFYLIGRDTVPEIVALGENGRTPIDWEDYIYNRGYFVEEFKDPKRLLEQVGVRLNELLSKAENQAGKYFQANYIIDLPNLVSESILNQTFSVHEAMLRVRSYLKNIVKRIQSMDRQKRTVSDRIILSNIISTITRIDSILSIYNELSIRSESYLTHFKSKDSEQIINLIKNDKEFDKTYSRIIQKIYFEFNVLIQRDNFLSTRLGTFVKYDLSYYSRNKKDLTSYERDLLVAANSNILDRFLSGAVGSDPNKIKEDLNTAQIINIGNLKAVESLFSDSLVPAIEKLDMISKGKKSNDTAMWFRGLKRFMKDSITAPYNLIPTLYNLFYHSDKYFSIPGKPNQVELKEDRNRSFSQFKARLCIQTLAFQHKSQFVPFCKDAFLKSSFAELAPEMKLKLSYSDLLLNYARAIKSGNMDAVRATEDDNRCALRNYRRKNTVYWMVKSFQN